MRVENSLLFKSVVKYSLPSITGPHAFISKFFDKVIIISNERKQLFANIMNSSSVNPSQYSYVDIAKTMFGILILIQINVLMLWLFKIKFYL